MRAAQTCVITVSLTPPAPTFLHDVPSKAEPSIATEPFHTTDSPIPSSTTNRQQLKHLSELRWPPEPDAAIFTDPLLREDPKPLRKEELMRIGQSVLPGFKYPVCTALIDTNLIHVTATSPQLRLLLANSTLPQILRILDKLPNSHTRSSALSRLLSIDPISLSKPDGSTFLNERSSPPPLHELLSTISGAGQDREEEKRVTGNEDGWWLGHEGSKEGRIWIGGEAKRLMRLWARVVCMSIDGGQGDEWGQGSLAWEV